MSERKTTEIKLRVTPEEKTRWQLEADRQGIGLSELIRDTMNGSPERLYEPRIELPTPSVPVARKVCSCSLAGKGVCCDTPQEVVSAPRSVGTTGEVGSVQSKEWMYEAKPGATIRVDHRDRGMFGG